MRFRSRAAAAVAAFALIPTALSAQPATHSVTIDGVLSAPYIYGLTASPDGGTVVYSTHERAAHNIYAFRVGASPHLVVGYAADDGEAVQDLNVAKGGGAIAYSRGGRPNRRGQIADPTSSVVNPHENVWIVNVAGGKPLRVAGGSQPQFSPDNRSIVWLADGALMHAALTWKGNSVVAVGKSSQMFYTHGNVSDVRFSPDGSKIAFANGRGDHTFVAIYDLGAKHLIYMSPNFRNDESPVWSPDGRSVAFLRLPGDLDGYPPSLKDPLAPFSIWVGDPNTGVAHEIWKADPGMGSQYYWLDAADQLFWSKDNRIAFVWEKNGWRNLWTVPAAGGAAAVDVTPGQFEVESAVESLDGTQLLYATNEDDIARRHIWSVGFDAANPSALTSGKESQWYPTALARGSVAYVNAGWSDAPQVVVRDAAGKTISEGPQIPASFPAAAMVEPQLVTFNAPDGLLIHGELYKANDTLAKHCGVIFVHGGSMRQMLPGFHYMEAYANLYEINQYIANHGCDVLSVEYRSGVMFGHDFREAPGVGEHGGAEYQDVLAGAKFLQAQPGVDPSRIGIYGLSWGGYLTALALARNSDIFKVGFDMAGVHNWYSINDGGGNGSAQWRDTAIAASPVGSIDKWTSPVFLAQGDDDRNVPFSQGVDLDQRLRAQGVDVDDMVFPNENHEMTLVFTDAVKLYTDGTTFLLTHLGATP